MGYVIDLSQHVWRITFSTTLTNEDIALLAKDSARLDASQPVVPNRLVDLRQLEAISIGFLEMSRFTEQRKAAKLPNNVKSGFVTNSPIQVGFARMFQTLLDHPQIEVRIFNDEKAALEWLGVL